MKPFILCPKQLVVDYENATTLEERERASKVIRGTISSLLAHARTTVLQLEAEHQTASKLVELSACPATWKNTLSHQVVRKSRASFVDQQDIATRLGYDYIEFEGTIYFLDGTSTGLTPEHVGIR